MLIPADLQLPPQTKLKVIAWYRDSREVVEMPLAVEPARYITQLASDKPLYKPGETVFYRSLTLSQFALAADRDMPVHFDILAPDGSLVPNSSRDLVTQRGVASGDFAIPKDMAAGRYMLVVRGSDATFLPARAAVDHPGERGRLGRIGRAGRPPILEDRRDILP